ncbi:MAG TPA: UDP-3-O-acyl-N-acetylglucosamine deacetylase [Polyangiaceae bacterium]|nr:UDP-3-O-acyl-N-acetylglucosamine deacetylase [Polyangiaceae bacterium]
MTSSPREVCLRGLGLHTGQPSEVRLTRSDGPVVFRTALGEARIDELRVVRCDHGVRVRCERIGFDVDTVEHFLAALGGLSIHSGVAIEVDGPELPLLDGGALAFANALAELASRRDAPASRVLREGVIRVGASTYELTPGDEVVLDVEASFDAPRIGRQAASWRGSADAFVRDVAWARTFGFRRDGEALRRSGRARAVDPTAVMVLDDDGAVEPPGKEARPEEFARHKLLDLVGDLYLFGGPPRGTVRATRPGHAATHRAMAEAREQGIVGK